jgi:ferrous iron transport protein B
LTALLFAGRPLLGGVAFAACYFAGAAAALLSALLFRRTLLRGRARPMILELPSYKTPSLLNALVAAKDQGLAFLKTAGTAIMAICVVMWWLNTFPRVPPPPEALALQAEAAATADAGQREDLQDRADAMIARAGQASSFAGQIGRAIQPVFAPLGYDWQLTVGVLTSFLAREVFVSTMTVLVVDTTKADEAGVIARIRAARRDNGDERPGLLRPGDAVSADARGHAPRDGAAQVGGSTAGLHVGRRVHLRVPDLSGASVLRDLVRRP